MTREKHHPSLRTLANILLWLWLMMILNLTVRSTPPVSLRNSAGVNQLNKKIIDSGVHVYWFIAADPRAPESSIHHDK